jgi:hypothetical protein
MLNWQICWNKGFPDKPLPGHVLGKLPGDESNEKNSLIYPLLE